MSAKPDVPTHPNSGLNERSSSSDKQGSIERYYKLLSSSHSVDSTSNTVIPNRSKSEGGDVETEELPQSRIDETTTEITPEIALSGMYPQEAGRPRGPSVLPSHGAESCGTEKSQAAENAPLNELSSDHRKQLLRESLPGSESYAVKPVSTYAYSGRKEVIPSHDQQRLRFDKLPRVRKRIAFGALCAMIAVSISIAGLSLIGSGRNAEPTPTHVQSDISSRTEGTTIPAQITRGSEIEDQKLQKQEANADPLQAPKPSKPAEPSLAVPGTLQSRAVGVRETDLTAQREVVPPQPSNAGQVDGTQQSTGKAAASQDPVHEPTPSVAQSSLSASQRSAETPSHSDTGQQLQATPNDDPKVAATAPTKNLIAGPPSRAHAAKRRRASTPRRDAGPRRYIHQ